MSPYPNIRANRNGFSKLHSGTALIGFTRMVSCIYLYARPDLSVRTDLYPADVQKDAAKVHKYTVADKDIVAVINVEWCTNGHLLANCAQMLNEQRSSESAVLDYRIVIGSRKSLGPYSVSTKLRITRIVEFAA